MASKLALVKSSPPWRDRVRALYLRVKRALKASHWIFRLPETILLRLQQQDEDRKRLEEMRENMRQWATQQVALATLTKGINERLLYHERKGPLRDSRERFDRQRQDGITKPHTVVQHTPKRKPAKSFDASSNIVELPPNPPPAEAADHPGDEPA